MGYGTVQVGRLALREALVPLQEKADGNGVVTVTITGQEASPPHTLAEMAAIQDDIRGLSGMLVPVTWSDKADRNGYYTVSQPQATLVNWGGEVVTCDWQLTLTRAGSPSEVDLESRLGGPLTRVNAAQVTGERWHCPPGGHSAYWSAAGSPSTMTRTGEDGPLVVYRGVPLAVSPRYAVELNRYPYGRVRFQAPMPDTGTLRERSGTMLAVDPASQWELQNTLVRARWDSGGLRVASHDGTQWEQLSYVVSVAGVVLGQPVQVSVVRNDYECGVVRLLWARSPVGRTQVDLTVRRGSRLVECYAQSLPATTISVGLLAPVATTTAAGYIVGSADDVAGNRFMIASAASTTASVTASSLSASSVTALDFAVGAVVGGGSAQAGDGAAALYAQYCGAVTEGVRAVHR